MDSKLSATSQPSLALIPSELMERAEYREVDAGETMFHIGDRVRSLFYVVSGEVRLVRRGRNGSEVVLQRSHQGFVAEASLNSKAYHCDVVVARKGTVVGFPVRNFRSALDTNLEFRDAWMAHLAREVRRLRSQCERLSLNSAAERILHYIESEGVDGAVMLSQSRKAWAAELGLTHEALYRTLRRLQDNGVLRIDGNVVALKPFSHHARDA